MKKPFTGQHVLVAAVGGLVAGWAIRRVVAQTRPAGQARLPVLTNALPALNGPRVPAVTGGTSALRAAIDRAYQTEASPINPYRAAELASGEVIDWASVADPAARIHQILGGQGGSRIISPATMPVAFQGFPVRFVEAAQRQFAASNQAVLAGIKTPTARFSAPFTAANRAPLGLRTPTARFTPEMAAPEEQWLRGQRVTCDQWATMSNAESNPGHWPAFGRRRRLRR